MISLVRVDNRLIHGQVVEAWLPHLKVQRVVVADDEAAESPLIRAAMGIAVQGEIEVLIERFEDIDYQKLGADGVKTLLLLREVQGIAFARAQGLSTPRVNLGNVHFATGRKQVSASVFLSQAELDQLKMLSESGVEVEARAVPSEKALHLADMLERFGKGT